MIIKVNIFHAQLSQAMHNRQVVHAEGNSVGDCLDDLVKQFPEVEILIFNKQHQLRKEIFVFVNAESLHKVELNKPVTAGDVLIIAMLVTGG